MKSYRLSAGFALELWPALVPYIDRAAKYHPFLKAEGLSCLVSNQLATVFITTDDSGILGFAAVEVIEYPGHRVANVLYAAGRRGFLGSLTGELMEKIEAWAIEQEATSLSMTGRPGWLKVARRFGWTPQVQTFAHKELTYGKRWRQTCDGRRESPELPPEVV